MADPYASYLKRAAALFEAGDIVQAGQIWQAILKKLPDHEESRAGLYKVKLHFDARATQDGLADRGATPSPAPVRPGIPQLLTQGCAAYDAGCIDEAVQLWEQVLEQEPGNELAKGYISGARRAAVQAEPEPFPAPSTSPDDTEHLLRDGCTLYDMGQLEDAMGKWEAALRLDPAHSLARSYLQDVRRDLGLPPLEEGAVPAPAPQAEPVVSAIPAEAAADHLEHLLQEGVQLYDMGMIPEAIEKWRQLLAEAPDHADAHAYLAMAQKDLDAPPPAPATPPRPAPIVNAPAPLPSRAPLPTPEPSFIQLDTPAIAPVPFESAEPVAPPPALTSSLPASRKGLSIPRTVKGTEIPAWVLKPAFVFSAAGGLILLLAGLAMYQNHRQETQLKQAVATFASAATAPVARNIQVVSLGETPEEIRKEGESALAEDPFRAYCRAQELIRLLPGDPQAASLLNRAKAALPGKSPEGSLQDYEAALQKGNLEAGEGILAGLLRQAPDDGELRIRYGRLCQTLARIYASKEHWGDARDALRRGRAMFPWDKSWGGKLKLLEHIETMNGSERQPWVQLLG